MTEPPTRRRGSLPDPEALAADVAEYEDGSRPPPPAFFDNVVTATIPVPVESEE